MTMGLACDREGYDLRMPQCPKCGSRGCPELHRYNGKCSMDKPKPVLSDSPSLEYVRAVLNNNIERANDIVWDLQNKPEFNRSDPNVLGLMDVAKQIVVSLTALFVGLDNAPAALSSHNGKATP